MNGRTSSRRWIGGQNLDALMAEYEARGGSVTKCEPGDADAPMRKLTRVRTPMTPAPGRAPLAFDDAPYLSRWSTAAPAADTDKESAAA